METAETCWQRGEGARVAGRADEAAIAYRRTLALAPDFAPAQANLALVLQAAGAAWLRRAIALVPDHPLLRFNLGNLLAALGRPGAGAAFRQSLALAPGEAAAWLNLGVAVHGEGRLGWAVRAAGRALALAPLYAEAWNNLANVRRDQGRIDDAIALYGQALACRPGYADADRNRLCARLYIDDDEALAGREAAAFVGRHGPRTAPPPAWTSPKPERRLRVGLLSSDLGDHPVGRNIAGFVANRDRSALWLAAYDTGGRGEPLSDWFRTRVDLWRNVSMLDDRAIAEVVRSDRIDVLVVLAGRFDRNRPLVAAWRAAPVQVAMYDGGASGMGEGSDPAIAAWITDAALHPEGERAGGDRLLRLPAYCSFLPPEWPPAERRAPADGTVVLASFSNPAKLSLATLSAWARILGRLPQARLQLKYRTWYADPEVQARIVAAIARGGGDPGRVEFLADADDAAAHLGRYGGVDLALDPFPFSGVTTSFEALAMGVPVLSLAGHAAIGRTTAAILLPLGLDELVASSVDDYVERACRLAGDRPGLARLGGEAARRLKASPLVDGRAHAAALAEAFRRLWRDWCRRAEA